ncbi:MAG: DNA recombination protein RmuC [Candidatus Nanohaloarchaea archaeon]|nr:DNA recombination protein RmuC [Candidatus Nanohaloarchaea archaeon]
MALTTMLLVVILLLVLYVAVQESNRSRVDVDVSEVRNALNESWRELGFDQQVGKLEDHAATVEDLHRDLEQMLRLPKERGAFGEQQLDTILADHLPEDMYGVREQVVDGKTPDAHIESSSGTVCIDSKFPLDNYEQYLDARQQGDEATADQARKRFRRDVEQQLEKIASDYVRPEQGTTEFAFAFIPSEAVYHHLVTEEQEMLQEFTKRGVQVVSPLTLGHKLELIKADIHARQLSRQAEEVQQQLQQLRSGFESFGEDWETFYRHVRNAKNKADDVQSRFEELRDRFRSIADGTLEDDS